MDTKVVHDMKSFDAVVVGSGASGYAAACRIAETGKATVCIVTEGIDLGASRGAESDGQIYYGLTPDSGSDDRIRSLATDLFSCGSVDGDNALWEASLSARCFADLCSYGVPFPKNESGEYVGVTADTACRSCYYCNLHFTFSL